MSKANPMSVLSGLTVREAMRRLVVHLFKDATVAQAIREMIKFKVNAVLVANEENEALGVVSKTNILGAYYAGLPIGTLIEDVMVAPVLFCGIDDSLDAALDKMRANGVPRLYVSQESPHQAAGVLAYPDILGLLYRYCHKCPKSTIRLKNGGDQGRLSDHFKVCELMNQAVFEHSETDSLIRVMERLFTEHGRTVLVKGKEGAPVGVVSTTDFMVAYLHGLPHDAEVKAIMSSPVRSCDQDEPLVMAIQKMIFADVHNLYVYKEYPRNIVGVLSLSDAARVRSGSCRACLVSRFDLTAGP